MPHPIWESSQKPLYPKCIWVDSFGTSNSGRRHFIFDYNIPNGNIYYPKSLYCSCNNNNDSSNNFISLENQFRTSLNVKEAKSLDWNDNKILYLSVVGSADIIQCDKDRKSISSEKEFNESKSQQSDIKTNEIETNVILSQNTDNSFGIDIDTKSQTTTSIDATAELSSGGAKQAADELEHEQNYLADRVLQWLDLASGRDFLLKRSEHIERALAKFKRRSLTAKELRESNEHSPARDPNPRHRLHRESIHQLSMVFNEDETYSSAPNKDMIQKSSTLNFNIFPVTYRCSKKFLSLRRAATVPAKTSDLMESIETMPAICNAKNEQHRARKRFGRKHRIKRMEFIDDQYRSMIQRRILEQSCNVQMAKRQLHIFMPFSESDKNTSNSVREDLNSIRLESPSIKSISDKDSCKSSQRSKK